MVQKYKCAACGKVNAFGVPNCTECLAELGTEHIVELQAESVAETSEVSSDAFETSAGDAFVCSVDENPGPLAAMAGTAPIEYELAFGTGKRVPLGQGQLLGRSSSGVQPDIQAETGKHPGVSRLHAWIGLVNQDLVVLDLGSTNGTCVGDEMLDRGKVLVVESHNLPVVIRLGSGLKLTLARERTKGE